MILSLPIRSGGRPHTFRGLSDVARNRTGTIPAYDLVRALLESPTSPADGYADLASRQEVVVVFRIADGDRIVRRQTQRGEGLAKPGSFTNRLRKHHEAAAVEQQHQRQFELADHGQDAGSKGRVGLYYALAGSEVDPTVAEFIQENGRWRMADQPGMPVWKGQYGPVFRYHGVNKLKVSCYPLQVRKNAAGHEDNCDSAGTRLRDGGPHVRIEYSIACDRPIVVERQYPELQGSSFSSRAFLRLQFRAGLKQLKHLAPRDHATQMAIRQDWQLIQVIGCHRFERIFQ